MGVAAGSLDEAAGRFMGPGFLLGAGSSGRLGLATAGSSGVWCSVVSFDAFFLLIPFALGFAFAFPFPFPFVLPLPADEDAGSDAGALEGAGPLSSDKVSTESKAWELIPNSVSSKKNT